MVIAACTAHLLGIACGNRGCATLFDRNQFCQHCDEIYADATHLEPSWISCISCQRSVHRQCELKSGTPLSLMTQGPGWFKCRQCRERGTAFTPFGSVLQVPTPYSGGKRVLFTGSDDDSADDDTDGTPGAFLDFAFLILKAAEHVKASSSQDTTLSSFLIENPALDSNSSNVSCSMADGDVPDPASGGSPAANDQKGKRRRSKAARTERQEKIASSNASLPNMRKTILTLAAGSVPKPEGDTGIGGVECHWAQCDNPRCLKWRRLPQNLPLDALRGKWTCKMNRWDPQHSSCDDPEQELFPGEALPDLIPGDHDYDQQKAEFYTQLKKFLEDISCPMLRNPTLGGKDLDLFHLYRQVTQRGGFDMVVAIEGTWARIFRTLPNYSPTVTDASYRLKRYYQEFLQSFEQRMFFRKDMCDIQVKKFQSRRAKKTKQADPSSPVQALLNPTNAIDNLVAYSLSAAKLPNRVPPQCIICKRGDQLVPCDPNAGALRVWSTPGSATSPSILVCRQCLATRCSPPRSTLPGSSPVLPRIPIDGLKEFAKASTIQAGFVGTVKERTDRPLPAAVPSKFYQSLPVQFPAPMP
ncbi:unnamed protein product (mitochondrion) [Plasmodiophora brassicae]|uniref:ARID domain-containing protein n=1 Tax=Plasmodiophora brassicae TaxID=37360 RepID=A0A3P3Y132_PLABS|nr:unnamed protein product [Plasmodiophora brassicae]